MLGLCLAGTLFVQVVMVPLLAVDLEGEGNVVLGSVRLPALAVVLLVLVVLVLVAVQVRIVCVRCLLTMLRRDEVI